MAEGFNFQPGIYLLPDDPDLLQAQLPGQHHPACAQVKPGLGAFVVCNGLLGGDMPLTPGGILSRQGKGPQIGQDQGVHPRILKLFQIGGKLMDLFIAGHGIDGNVTLDPMLMGEFHCQGQLLGGKVPRERTHPEAGARQIYGVRTVGNGHFEPLHIPGGAEQFQFPHLSCLH